MGGVGGTYAELLTCLEMARDVRKLPKDTGTIGLGGFQETDQLPIFSKITKYQAHVNNRARMAELTGRAFDRAKLAMGPSQLNIPRDFFYGDIECEIPRPIAIRDCVSWNPELKGSAHGSMKAVSRLSRYAEVTAISVMPPAASTTSARK